MVAVFSLRGIYFCYLKEINIPTKVTGLTVGIISLIGYFPDIYIGPFFGFILDNYEKSDAFNKCFLFLFFISLLGACSALLLNYFKIKTNK